MATPPRELVDDALAEIFLHLPPDEPAHLVRAALVCKRWRRILTGGAFLRSYRAFHGAAPLLGFLDNTITLDGATAPRFSPTSAATASPSPFPRRGAFDCLCWDALDCRHGRVLLGLFADKVNLVVWDPITGDHRTLPDPGLLPGYYTAAVFCAARDGCDHLHCRDGGGPFRIVLAGMDYFARGEDAGVHARVYCSDAAAWVASAHLRTDCNVMRRPSAVVGDDDVYFQLSAADDVILRYDVSRNRLSTFDPPPAHANEGGIVLLPMDDGGDSSSSSLGLAGVRGSRLCLWSTIVGAEGIEGWMRRGDIELMTRIPFTPYSEASVIACAEGLGTIFFFVSTEVGLFTIDLKSGKERKVSEPRNYDDFAVFPFVSFYTPDCTSGKLPSPRITH